MQNRTFTFSTGVTVHLKKIKQTLISRLVVDRTDKFPVPQKLVKVGTRQEEKLIPDYNNKTFAKLVEDQKSRDIAETLSNLSIFSVVENTPEDVYDYYHQMAVMTQNQNIDDNFIKSLWILDQIDSDEELSDFYDAVLGQENVTERGVTESTEKFQD